MTKASDLIFESLANFLKSYILLLIPLISAREKKEEKTIVSASWI